jgi:putative tricarboxylic transport membrane protein
MLEYLASGLETLLSLSNFLFINVGILIGIIFGALPGLTVALAIVLFLPFTFGLSAVNGILMLLGIYCAGTYGGSISAILIKTPGTPSSAATIIDGYPLAQKGHPRKALLMALTASAISGFISALILLIAGPQLAKATLFFGPAEYTALAVFGLSIVASLCSENLLKGIIAGSLGLFISTLGIDFFDGTYRFTFGNYNLFGGIELVPALIGLFAISEILAKGGTPLHEVAAKRNIRLESSDRLSFEEVYKNLGTIVRSSLIGTVIGAVPGTGGGIAAFFSYNEAKRTSKNRDEFGKGSLTGIAAPEAGNNGVTGATLIPLLTLGIPGDGAVAILLGAFMMHGLLPGPSLFTEHGSIIYAVMLGLLVVNVFLWIQGRLLIKYFAMITVKAPEAVLTPILIFLCSAGAFSLNGTMFNVYIILVFGIIAYLLTKFGYPIIPLLLGLILGPTLEQNLRRALIISEGSLGIFFTRPISVFFIVITVLSVGFSLYQKHTAHRKENTNQ